MSTTALRASRLFIALAAFFLTNALLGEFVGVKIFALEATLGADAWRWRLLGVSGTLNFTAGVLLWPFVFILTDVINEYYGVRGVRLISWTAVACIAYAFVVAYVAIALAPADFWVAAHAARRPRHPARLRTHLRPGPVDDRGIDHGVPHRPAHRCDDFPPHSPGDG